MTHTKLLLLSLLVLAPASAFAIFKPVRVLLPEAFGVVCRRDIRIDDRSRWNAAAALLDAAKAGLGERSGLRVGNPRVIFCSTEACRTNFGLGKKAGYSFGSFGIVVAPRGWKDYYLAHELIHHWQADTFGSLALLNGEPWLIEGMAYALSNDPRQSLNEPFESYRREFAAWQRQNAGVPLEESVAEAL